MIHIHAPYGAQLCTLDQTSYDTNLFDQKNKYFVFFWKNYWTYVMDYETMKGLFVNVK